MNKKLPLPFIYALILLVNLCCNKNSSEKNQLKFNRNFFQQYVPELPGSRLLQKSDLPLHQQQFFDEAGGQLQLLVDLNKNNIPEYVVTGVSEQYLKDKIKKPYFIAIFERLETGISRHFFQQVYIPPVHINIADNTGQKRIVISFAFYSDYGAAIYFDNGEYHLEKW